MDFKLAEIYGDGMIIQRDKPVVILGEALKACEIHAVLDHEIVSLKVTPGFFKLELPSHKAGKNLELHVWTDNQNEVIKNVFCGEVWIAGGQSNMAFELRESGEYRKGMPIIAQEKIRFYTVGQNALSSRENYGKGYEWAYSQDSGWLGCSEKTAPYFSAAGYFFAEKLYQELQVPIGIISCCVGGSGIFAWMPEEAIASNPELVYALEDFRCQNIEPDQAYKDCFHKYLDACREGVVDVSSVAGHPGVLPCVFFDQPGPYNFKRPCGLYNAMYKKIVDYAVRGMIWYQGESEAFAETASTYASAMETLLKHLKSHQTNNYEFHFSQIAPWKNEDIRQWEDICNEQRIFALNHPECGMATIGDYGGGEDIHPSYKKPVGERLAYAAMSLTYGKTYEYSGPIAVSANVEGTGIRILFLHNEGMYFAKEPGIFEAVYKDGTIRKGVPRIEEDSIFLELEIMENLEAVRYEYYSDFHIGLFNEENLPASIFRLKI